MIYLKLQKLYSLFFPWLLLRLNIEHLSMADSELLMYALFYEGSRRTTVRRQEVEMR